MMNNLRKSAGPTIKIIDSKIYPYEPHMLQERARAAENRAADDFITAAWRLVKLGWWLTQNLHSAIDVSLSRWDTRQAAKFF